MGVCQHRSASLEDVKVLFDEDHGGETALRLLPSVTFCLFRGRHCLILGQFHRRRGYFSKIVALCYKILILHHWGALEFAARLHDLRRIPCPRHSLVA